MVEQKLFSAENKISLNMPQQYTVAASYLSTLLAAGDQLGISRQQCLDHLAMTEQDLSTHSNRIELNKFLQLADFLQQQTNRVDIGLVMAQVAKPSSFSALGYAAMSCKNLFEAAALIPRYEDVVVNAGITQLAVKEGLGAISWQAKEPWLNHPVLLDMIVAGWFCFAKWATGDTEHYPVKVRFSHARPDNDQAFQQLFNCPIEYQADSNEILFDADYLQEPFAHSDEEFNQLMRQRADSLIEDLQSPDSISMQVTEILQNILPKHEANIASVALALNMSERTLRRRLADENQSFQQLLINLRQKLARFYLHQTELSMLDIALLLGYSDQSTFTTAFKSWFQLTPSDWRQLNQ